MRSRDRRGTHLEFAADTNQICAVQVVNQPSNFVADTLWMKMTNAAAQGREAMATVAVNDVWRLSVERCGKHSGRDFGG